MGHPQNWDLKTLLGICQDKGNKRYEAAWREFMARYRDAIYGHVYYSCRAWKVSRLNRQLSETVEDIMAEVFRILMRSLSSFQAVDKPAMFHSWLAVIAYRAAGRYMQRFFTQQVIDGEIGEFPETKSQLDPHYRRILYEYVVDRLREANGGQKRNGERDIHIFMLTAWSDFPLEMLQKHPGFPELKSPYAAKSVIKRMREQLRKIKF